MYVFDDLCRTHLADHRAQLTRPKVKDLHKTRLTSVHCVDEWGADVYLCLNFAYDLRGPGQASICISCKAHDLSEEQNVIQTQWQTFLEVCLKTKNWQSLPKFLSSRHMIDLRDAGHACSRGDMSAPYCIFWHISHIYCTLETRVNHILLKHTFATYCKEDLKPHVYFHFCQFYQQLTNWPYNIQWTTWPGMQILMHFACQFTRWPKKKFTRWGVN